MAVLALSSVIASTTQPAYAVGGTVGSVSGTVVDDLKQPVANASITISSPSGSQKAVTNSKGFFSILGLQSDTYTLSVEKAGYQSSVLSGVTVSGDSSLDLGSITLSRKTIGKVQSRAANSAFQPSQTQDVTTLSGARIEQALGFSANNNEQQLLLAAPGVQLSSSGDISIRGSLGTEIGYQFDGVNFSAPFFDENGSGSAYKPGGYLNGISGGSGSAIQVVNGAGDATQGNIGAGVINLIPGRGTYPGSGEADFTVGAPYFNHQLDFNYGIATQDGHISEYVAVDEQRYTPEYAPYGVAVADIGEYNGVSYIKHDDVISNTVIRFGKDNDQSFQILYRTEDEQDFGNAGGLTQAEYYPYNPLANEPWAEYEGLYGFNPVTQPFQDTLKLFPGVPSTNQLPTSNEQIGTNPTYFIKLGYTKNFGSATFLQADYYNWNQQQQSENYTAASNEVADSTIGGKRVGFDLDLTHQFGTQHTVTIATKAEVAKPLWDADEPTLGIDGLIAGGAGVNLGEFAVPVNGVCQSPAAGIPGVIPPAPNGCYVYNELNALGIYNGKQPIIPSFGIDYHNASFLQYGLGIRDQWTVSSKLKIDYGIREDIANYKFGPDATGFAGSSVAYNEYANPSDLPPSLLSAQFLTPHVIQPRFAFSYQFDPNDDLRASYGRSVEFVFGQEAGTPMNITDLDPRLALIPATDTVAAPACGSGLEPAGTKGYAPNPAVGGGEYFKCANFAQQIFWAYDQNLDAPDYGGQGQPTYSNYDISYSHLFGQGPLSGWGTKVTSYWRRDFNVVENVLLQEGPISPVTGQSSAAVFGTRPDGVEKTFGLEGSITTPDKPSGFTGFFTADYLSEYGSEPPASQGGNYSSDTFQPIVSQALLSSGTLFRQGYLPPFSIQTGFAYKTKWGLKIQPIISANTGYPTGVGANTLTTVNGVLLFVPATNYAYGPIGGPGGAGETYNSPAFVDPALPGKTTAPNIAATRGYNEPALPGGALSNPGGNINLDVEYTIKKGLTVGTYITNLLNEHYGVQYQNTKYQGVATGIAGPQTGQNLTDPNPASAYYANYLAGARDEYQLSQSYGAFNLPYNAGTVYQVYLQVKF